MSSTTSANIEKLVINRTYKAPASRVYAAWTQADLLKQWFRPEDAFLSDAQLDVHEYDTLVTLDFRERNGETDFTLTHENFAKEESRENHSRGWNSALDKLPAFL